MAGIRLHVRVDDEQAQDALQAVMQRMSDPRPAFRDAGEYMQRVVDDRFRGEHDPDGQPWQDLAPLTWTKKRNDKILTERGGPGLRGSIHYRTSRTALEQGTDKIYAAIHQLGGIIRTRNAQIQIPARQYLGFSDGNAAEVSRILYRHAFERRR
ncbi:phage virion morphogenesis protein [Desulfonatronovibrio hydrogenovorans]|uniref:phage virion morphogenesis protein n=1 Tax=Desulfonatronovibrio hydrogenovorans TaxID=53245 RepID=UPI000A704B85|nr:phage virion morphogenesis protein [Desulfonatronovibrio hydrogenovorans]